MGATFWAAEKLGARVLSGSLRLMAAPTSRGLLASAAWTGQPPMVPRLASKEPQESTCKQMVEAPGELGGEEATLDVIVS